MSILGQGLSSYHTVVHIMQQNCLSVVKDVEVMSEIKLELFPRVIGAFGMAVPVYISVTYLLRNFYLIISEKKNPKSKHKVAWLICFTQLVNFILRGCHKFMSRIVLSKYLAEEGRGIWQL